MPMRHLWVNGVAYVAHEHELRDDGRAIPEYIFKCQAKSRLAWLGEHPHHFYFGYYETDRISFEMEGRWWYIDDQPLYDLLNDPRQDVKFWTL